MRRRSKSLRIGIAQIPIVMGDKRRNVGTILGYAKRAARRGCDVVVFPECSLTGWLSPAAKEGAETIPGPMTEALGMIARKGRMGIVIGLEEREGTKLFNSAVFIDRDGEIILRHRKIDELDIGLKMYRRGGSLSVGRFDDRPVGMNICADSWLPSIMDALYLMGAGMVFSPCAWAIQSGGEACNSDWIGETYRARTDGRKLFIVSANGVGKVTQGPWRGRVLHGDSMIFGPGGRKIMQGPRNKAALLTVRLEV